MTVKPKTRGRSKESQEQGWQKFQDKVDAFIKERPEDQLATLLAHLRALNLSRVNPTGFYKKRPAVAEFGKACLEHLDIKANEPFLHPVVSSGRYATHNISPIRYMMSAIRPETEAIVELGSGWSWNLFQLYVGLGRTRSKTIDYIGAEYTDTGRACANTIAGFDGAIRYQDQPMDYRAPDISFLKPYKKHILVFTHHSIEQVDRIDHHLYQMLSDLDAEVTLMHFEPVGWQRSKPLIEARRNKDKAYFEALGRMTGTSVSSVQEQMNNAAWWSWRGAYNINLTAITKRYIKSGQVVMRHKAYDFDGGGNVLNPTTLYHMDFIKS